MQEYLPSKNHYNSTAHSSVKWVPGVYCTMAVSHCPLMVVVGLRVPTPPMGGTVGTVHCELLGRALGVCVAPAIVPA